MIYQYLTEFPREVDLIQLACDVILGQFWSNIGPSCPNLLHLRLSWDPFGLAWAILGYLEAILSHLEQYLASCVLGFTSRSRFRGQCERKNPAFWNHRFSRSDRSWSF